MDRTPLFEATDLSFAHVALPALRGVSFRLAPGRIHGIVGPNGSGKTTLLDLLAGLRRPDAGQVLFRGRDVRTWRRRALAREIAYAPQESAVNFPFTAEEIALMGRAPHMGRFASPSARDWEVVLAALAELGVLDLRRRPITELSGGEKQRVVLARTLAQDTPVMLFDEPTANLDIRHGLDILDAIESRVRRQGRSAVLVMHDLNLAAAYCDECLVLDQGRVAASGATDQALNEESIARVFRVKAAVRPSAFAAQTSIDFSKGARP